jgi:hypothetical protein
VLIDFLACWWWKTRALPRLAWWQKIDIIGVYFHASDYQIIVDLIRGSLKQWCDTAPGGRIVLGDLNFVNSSSLDRRRLPAQQRQQRQQQQQQQQQDGEDSDTEGEDELGEQQAQPQPPVQQQQQ